MQCVRGADCGDYFDCVGNECFAFTPCESSLHCTAPEVCHPTSNRCVACVRDADCAEGQVCRNTSCQEGSCTPMVCSGRCGQVEDGCGGTLDCGACSGGCGPSALAFTEVHLGTADYLVVQNRSSACTVDLSEVGFLTSSLGLVFPGLPPVATNVDTMLSGSLAAGDSVYLVEDTAAQPGDIALGQWTFASTYASEARLCAGDCADDATDNVVDHVLVGGPQITPEPPRFSAPLDALADEAATSYLRTSFAGSPPDFLATDWEVGPASRPDPATMP